MKEIVVAEGKVALVDDADHESLMEFKWRLTNKGYVARGTKTAKTVLMHRVIMGISDESRHVFVDHIDRDPLNNTRANLRVCTHGQNQWNKVKSPNKSSQYKGVSWDKRYKKWVASGSKDGKNKKLGRFDNEVDAASAYNEFARINFGEFARVNDL